MPKWVYDPKTCSMVQKDHNNDLEFHMLGMGFEICDYKNKVQFVVTPDDKIIFRDRAIHHYIYTDFRRAAIVAQRIRRVYPNSKYGDAQALLSWRRNNINNESMTPDDKAMLRCLLEEVDNQDVQNIKVPDNLMPTADNSLTPIPSIINQEENYSVDDAIGKIREGIEDLKKHGIKITADEMDFPKSYQVIIKIDKE